MEIIIKIKRFFNAYIQYNLYYVEYKINEENKCIKKYVKLGVFV